MDKRRRLIEAGKDVLIVLLACSALWLAARNQMLGPIERFFQEEPLRPGTGQGPAADRTEPVRPLRMAAALDTGAGSALYAALGDEAACDALFQQTAGILAETLSSAGGPEEIGRAQWEEALTRAPGVLFDFQGSIPLTALSGWLSREEIGLDASVRRLALSVWQDSVVLLYRDEADGKFYRCLSQVAAPLHLEEALSSLTENGGFYAFQSEAYTALDPDTLLTAGAPSPAVFASANAMSGGQASLEELMEDLGLPINANGIYRGADDEWVARSGSATLRLSDRGAAVYEAGEGAADSLPIPGGGNASLFSQIDACRRLACAALEDRSGQGRLYLMSAARTEQGLEVEFGCSLDGIPVLLEDGAAAHFLVRAGRIERFELRFRSYTALEERAVLMPARQAAAALEAKDLGGEELLLVYSDAGGDRTEASWAASRLPAGEG